MRLLFIRHGDPDYEHDTLTEKGHREAALLGKLAPSLNLGQCFVSPLGRARHTAEYCLKSTGKQAQELKWLQEFPGTVDINHSPELQEAYPDCRKKGDRYELRIPWDMVPAYYTSHPEYMDREGWRHSEAARCSDTVSAYDSLAKNLDGLLSEHGYVRRGDHYFVQKENQETLTFFLSFWRNLRHACASVECVAVYPMAFSCIAAHFFYRTGNGRTAERNRLFPRSACRRYKTSFPGRRGAFLCLQIL